MERSGGEHMSKPKHWRHAKDPEEMVELLIREGYDLEMICHITGKKSDFVRTIAEKYELTIREKPLHTSTADWLLKHMRRK
jgi:hypothetical protein